MNGSGKWQVRCFDPFDEERFSTIISAVDTPEEAQADALAYLLTIIDEPENDKVEIISPDGKLWMTIRLQELKTASR